MWYALLIPVALAVTATLMYTLFSGIPEFGDLVESKKHEFRARINGLLFIVYLVVMRLFTTTHEGALEQISQVVAYMVYDCAHAPFYARGYDYYIHHIAYFLIYFLVIPGVSERRASQFYDAACILESSAPLLSMVWFMDALGYPVDTFHQTLRGLVLLVWTCIRMIYFPYWVGTTIESSDFVYTLPFMALNCYWFWLLCKKALKAFTSSSPSHTDADAGQRQEVDPPPSGSSQHE